jgi:hypothetical protein
MANWKSLFPATMPPSPSYDHDGSDSGAEEHTAVQQQGSRARSYASNDYSFADNHDEVSGQWTYLPIEDTLHTLKPALLRSKTRTSLMWTLSSSPPRPVADNRLAATASTKFEPAPFYFQTSKWNSPYAANKETLLWPHARALTSLTSKGARVFRVLCAAILLLVSTFLSAFLSVSI